MLYLTQVNKALTSIMKKITKQSISLGETDRKIINKLAEDMGMNFSAAVRFIVREWSEQRTTSEKQPHDETY